MACLTRCRTESRRLLELQVLISLSILRIRASSVPIQCTCRVRVSFSQKHLRTATYARVRRPAEPYQRPGQQQPQHGNTPAPTEQGDWHDHGAHNRRRQSILRLCAPGLAPLGLAPLHEPRVIPPPQRVRTDAQGHAHKQPQEGQAHLREREAVVVLEDQGKSPEEQIQDA